MLRDLTLEEGELISEGTTAGGYMELHFSAKDALAESAPSATALTDCVLGGTFLLLLTFVSLSGLCIILHKFLKFLS